MNQIRRFFTGAKNIQKSSYIWNIISCSSNSFQSMLLLLFISRYGSSEDAAIFTISFSVATLMLFIGKYGVRNFQVSDIKQEFSFADYKRARLFTTILMGIVCVGYVLWGFWFKEYSTYKCFCMLTLMGPRIIESIEDVFHGELHQKGRLDVSAKIWGMRTILYMIFFAVTYIVTKDLFVTGLLSFGLTLVLCILFNSSVKDMYNRGTNCGKKSVKLILQKCFMLALSTTLITYITNAPKYAIDGVVSDQTQTDFGIIFMFVFVISLLGSYIFNPMIGKLSVAWSEASKKNFIKIVGLCVGFVGVITIGAIVAGETIGIRILEMLYKVDLSAYSIHLVLMIISGGILTLLNFTIIVATVVRQQGSVKTALLIGIVGWLVFNKYILERFNLLGLVVFFTCILFVILIVSVACLYYKIKTEKRKTLF